MITPPAPVKMGICLALVLALGRPAVSFAQSKAERAETITEEGVQAARAGNYDRAVALFEAAYALDPVPVLLYHIGRAKARGGDVVGGIEALRRYIGVASSAKARARGQRALEEIRRSYAGRIFVASNVEGAVVEVDGAPVGRTPLSAPLEVSAGQHVVVVRDASGRVARETILIQAGGDHRITLSLAAEPKEPPRRDEPALSKATKLNYVLALKKVGMSDEEIIREINMARLTFSVDSYDYVYLNERGLSAGVVRHMTRTPYLFEDVVTSNERRLMDIARSNMEDMLARMPGRLRINSTVEGAEITIDGETAGRTPMPGLIEVAVGTHRVKVKKDGYVSMNVSVRIAPEETVDVPVLLVARPQAETTEEQARGDGDGNTLAWVLAGAGVAVLVAGGITTAILLNQDGGGKTEPYDTWFEQKALMRWP